MKSVWTYTLFHRKEHFHLIELQLEMELILNLNHLPSALCCYFIIIMRCFFFYVLCSRYGIFPYCRVIFFFSQTHAILIINHSFFLSISFFCSGDETLILVCSVTNIFHYTIVMFWFSYFMLLSAIVHLNSDKEIYIKG